MMMPLNKNKMAFLRLGFVSKTLLLSVSTLFLTGCYKIEIKETLNLDGTSKIAVKMDMSQMMGMMTGMTEGFAQGFAEGFENGMNETSFTMGGTDMQNMMSQNLAAEMDSDTRGSSRAAYTGCDDPLLLADFKVQDLSEADKKTMSEKVTKATSCELGKKEGYINIVETYSNNPSKTNVIERKADTCDDPAILAFYQLPNFDEPILENFTIEKQITTTCRENDIEVIVSTLTTEIPEGEPLPKSFIFQKVSSDLEGGFDSNEFNSDIDTLMTGFDEAEAEASAANAMAEMNFCDEVEQDPEELPFFFDKCEDLAPGVGTFHFTKFDTTGFIINNNGTVTYSLEPSTEPIQKDLDTQMQQAPADDQALPFEMDPAAMGFVVEYVLVSPWPILEHSVGELEDEYTLRINLLEVQDEKDSLSVTLDTDGSTLNLLAPSIQGQIDKLIASLKEKLLSSDAPIERQVEYILHLSTKIQKLASLRPDQQVALGYLQTQLMSLSQTLQVEPFEALEAEFFEELEALNQDALAAFPAEEDFGPKETEEATGPEDEAPTQNSTAAQEPEAEAVETPSSANADPGLIQELEAFNAGQSEDEVAEPEAAEATQIESGPDENNQAGPDSQPDEAEASDAAITVE